MKILTTATLATLASLALIGAAHAADFEVKMLNKGEKGVMVFEPALIKAVPGDTVTFVPTDVGHNVETIEGMLPAGAAPIAGKMNEKVTVTLTIPGFYGVKCKPHLAMGMVGVIIVGKPDNIDTVKQVSLTGKAKKVIDEIVAGL